MLSSLNVEMVQVAAWRVASDPKSHRRPEVY
jgi:hypothetical protein